MSKISIFGMGYVGVVCAACLAKDGHSVVGVDVNATKVDLINRGRSPIVEKDLEPLIADGVREGRIRATGSARDAVLETDISFLCVGTPSSRHGDLDLSHVEMASREMGAALRGKKGRHILVVRSTILPGTTETVVVPAIESESGMKVGDEIGVVYHPEFMRESTAIFDFYHPPKTVLGGSNESDLEAVADLYHDIQAPLVRTSIRVAEMVKYADNAFHALKVTFSNEIGSICRALHIDSHEVMDIFCQDVKLNLSPYYLKPGFAFGGSCLPKDVRALVHKGTSLHAKMPVLTAILQSNEEQVRQCVRRIIDLGKKRIGVLGFAFKAGTDDLRESPIVELIEGLLGKGHDIRIYDREVSLAKLMGANKQFIEQHIPHISRMMVDSIDEIITHSEVVVVGNKSPEFVGALGRLRLGQHVFDLVRIGSQADTKACYEGIAW